MGLTAVVDIDDYGEEVTVEMVLPEGFVPFFCARCDNPLGAVATEPERPPTYWCPKCQGIRKTTGGKEK